MGLRNKDKERFFLRTCPSRSGVDLERMHCD
jgi:hypothetical protein